MSLKLERAIEIAAKAHSGQLDKADAPYILHPLRVMLALKSPQDQLAGVLHDVVEDSIKNPEPVLIEHLIAEGLSGDALEAVRLVTKDSATDYKIEANLMSYLEAIKGHEVARRVKIADLEDNLNLLRLKQIAEKDRVRLDRYLVAHRFLSG
jgi:(p)ppGpp synthase/HD superfamily hydrolase